MAEWARDLSRRARERFRCRHRHRHYDVPSQFVIRDVLTRVIRIGHGPENTSRLRRFAIGLIRAHSHCVAATLRKLQRNTRLVFDYLKLTRNTLTSRNHATLGGKTN